MPFYRHTTIDGWLTRNEDTIYHRTRLSMDDVCRLFLAFLHRALMRDLYYVSDTEHSSVFSSVTSDIIRLDEVRLCRGSQVPH